MRNQAIVWVDFAVRTIIVALVCYLLVSALFMSEFKKVVTVIGSLDDRINSMNKQIAYIETKTTVMLSRSPEMIYITALSEAEKGDIQESVKMLLLASELARQNSVKYKLKLEELISQGKARNSRLQNLNDK